MQPGTAEPLPLACQLPQALTQSSIIDTFRLVAIHRGRNIDQQAGFPLTQPKTLPGMRDRQTLNLGL